MKKIIVSVAQITPVFLNKEKTVAKACNAIKEAAQKDAKLIVFPEAFIPGYPEWVWMNAPGKKALTNPLFEALLENSVSIPDAATEKICRAAKNSCIYVVMGLNERNAEASNSSIYNTILYIDDKGKITGKHRKLVPTSGERLVCASGDGSTLESYDTPFGKLGGLFVGRIICRWPVMQCMQKVCRYMSLLHGIMEKFGLLH
jgi:nitrilase